MVNLPTQRRLLPVLPRRTPVGNTQEQFQASPAQPQVRRRQLPVPPAGQTHAEPAVTPVKVTVEDTEPVTPVRAHSPVPEPVMRRRSTRSTGGKAPERYSY